MKNFVYFALITIFFLVSNISFGQSLTFDQLVLIRSKSPMEIDSYLHTRGWKFSQPLGDDSIPKVSWSFPSIQGISQIIYLQNPGKPVDVLYLTPSRVVFDAIRSRLKAYGFEEDKSGARSGLWTQYMNAKYEVWLHIYMPSKQSQKSAYLISVSPQTKKRMERLDGGFEWIDPSRLEPLPDSLKQKMPARWRQ